MTRTPTARFDVTFGGLRSRSRRLRTSVEDLTPAHRLCGNRAFMHCRQHHPRKRFATPLWEDVLPSLVTVLELDHVFWMVSDPVQAARRLEDDGWVLDAGQAHRGQGTRNRRLA